MPTDPFANLASALENSDLYASVTVTRTVQGTINYATGNRSNDSTIGPITLRADKQSTQRLTRPIGGTPVEMEETVFNFRAASVAATALGTIMEGDVVTKDGIARRVVGVTPQVDDASLRCVCRNEKKGR